MDCRTVAAGQLADRNINRPPQPVSPESLQGVIQQTNSHLQDAESGLLTLLERLQPSDAKNRLNGEVPVVGHGMLNTANIGRNAASRIVDIIRTIDNLL